MRPLTAAENMQDYLVSFWPPDPALLLLVASPSCLIGNTKPGCSSVQNKQDRDSRRESERERGRAREPGATNKKKSEGKIISFTKRKIATSFTDRRYSCFPAFLKTFSCRWAKKKKRRLSGKRRWPSCVSLVRLVPPSVCCVSVPVECLCVCMCVCVYVLSQRLFTPLHCLRSSDLNYKSTLPTGATK